MSNKKFSVFINEAFASREQLRMSATLAVIAEEASGDHDDWSADQHRRAASNRKVEADKHHEGTEEHHHHMIQHHYHMAAAARSDKDIHAQSEHARQSYNHYERREGIRDLKKRGL